MDFSNIKQLFQQAKKMKEEMVKKKEILKEKEVKIINKEKSLIAVFSCDMKLKSLKIDSNFLNNKDIKLLENSISFVINKGLEEVKKITSNEMKSLTGGLNIPGF